METSRRALLGAIVVTPVLALPALPAALSSNEWAAAELRLEQARAAHLRAIDRLDDASTAYFGKAPAKPQSGLVLFKDGKNFTVEEAFANMKAGHAAWEEADRTIREQTGFDAADEADALAASASADAATALINTPAPDLAAIIRKIEVAIDYGRDAQELEGLTSDLRRLAGKAVIHG